MVTGELGGETLLQVRHTHDEGGVLVEGVRHLLHAIGESHGSLHLFYRLLKLLVLIPEKRKRTLGEGHGTCHTLEQTDCGGDALDVVGEVADGRSRIIHGVPHATRLLSHADELVSARQALELHLSENLLHLTELALQRLA